jgi:hypothetical protein
MITWKRTLKKNPIIRIGSKTSSTSLGSELAANGVFELLFRPLARGSGWRRSSSHSGRGGGWYPMARS